MDTYENLQKFILTRTSFFIYNIPRAVPWLHPATRKDGWMAGLPLPSSVQNSKQDGSCAGKR